jgi:uracil-DNA glycosylase
MNFKTLKQNINKCHKCRLWKNSHFAVFGEGLINSKIMLIGQNPGKEEDLCKKPFVGKAGKYLDKVLISNNFKRNHLFITSIVKHKTPNNRPPKKDEILACLPYLIEQILIIKPKIIVLMGNIAKKYVPRNKNIKYIETYHPAAAMRFPKIKDKFEKDFKKLRKTCIK